ncbi:MAG: HlyD family efflux transporter periplasmic adaptor subunit [Planctomycetota bacterium]
MTSKSDLLTTDTVDSRERVSNRPRSANADWSKALLFNLVVPLALLGVGGGIIYALGSVQPAKRPAADTTPVGRMRALPPVRTASVASLAELGKPLLLSADGAVTPFREVVIASEVAGQIIAKSPLCETGQVVTAGTILMQVDPTDYELEVRRLQRVQEQEYNSIAEVDQELVNTRRSLEIAAADIELQLREVKRLESLPKDFASQGEVDRARRTLLQAEQQQVNFQNQIDLLKKRRIRLEAAEQLAATQLRLAEINLERTKITAPIDGVVVMEQAELNGFVARGNPLVTLEDTSKVEVTTNLRVDQLIWILNQDAGVEADPALGSNADNLMGYKLPPTKTRIRYAVTGRDDMTLQWSGELVGYDGIGFDEQTRTVPVRVVVDNPRDVKLMGRDGQVVESNTLRGLGPSTLVRGMFVQLQFEIRPLVPLMVLPAESLKPGNQVWQFVGDPTVIERKSPNQDASNPSEVSKSPESEGPSVEAEATPFDFAAWEAGRLVVLKEVRPVERLLSGSALASSDDDRWICEVPVDTLYHDALVVVSPVGDFNSQEIPVRTRREDVSTDVETESGSETSADNLAL